MSPRKLPNYMVAIGAGRNKKFVRFSDSERCAHFLGVLSIAAQAPERGYLLVSGNEEAGPEEIANEAGGGVTVRVAQATMEKLKRIGILERDEQRGAWFVHDWWEINPEPDPTNAQRQAAFRERNGASNGDVTPDVTPDVTANNALKLKGKGNTELPAEAGSSARKRAPGRRVDQSKPPENFPEPLRPALDAVLVILHGVWDVRGGIEPQPRGVGLAIRRNERADHVRVARKLEHWLLAGTGQNVSSRDIVGRFGDWVENETAAKPQLAAVPSTDFSKYDRAAAAKRASSEGAA